MTPLTVSRRVVAGSDGLWRSRPERVATGERFGPPLLPVLIGRIIKARPVPDEITLRTRLG